MAAEYSTAPQVQQPYYMKQQAYTPMHSARQTPANVSPTSPRTLSHLPALQLQPPQVQPRKTPIYVPAALRRTEKPNKQSPPRIDSGFNSANSSWDATQGGFRKPADEYVRTDAAQLFSDAELEAPLSPVAGPVTRVHWQEDSSTSVCTLPSCGAPFTLFNRRHHCRKCGGIFCAAHSKHTVPLNEHALFHPDGDQQRACEGCFNAYRRWDHARSSRANSESSSSSNAVNIAAPAPAKRQDSTRVGSLAASLQGTWNWSTF